MDIAHRCTSGVTFSGSAKRAIIEGVARHHGYSSNPDKFVAMMNGAAKAIPKLKAEFDRNVYIELNRLEAEFGKPKPLTKKP